MGFPIFAYEHCAKMGRLLHILENYDCGRALINDLKIKLVYFTIFTATINFQTF